MIIKNTDLIGKKSKYLIFIISSLIDVAICIIFISIIVTTYNSTEIEKSSNLILLIVLSVLSTISIIDIIEIVLKKKNFAFLISQKILKNSKYNSAITLELNTTQKVFCESIYGIRDKSSYIYIFGKQNKGKSTAVLYLLDGFVKNSSDLSEIPWINNFTFIDCTSNKKEILEYFLMGSSINTRIHQFSNSVTVIDNIEQLGKTFFEENIGLFSSYKSLFIIIEDTTNNLPMCYLDIFKRSLLVNDFNSSVIGIKPIINLIEQLESLKPAERKVFFALFFLTVSSEFADIDEIKNIIKINRFSLYKALNKIKKFTIYTPFPFNSHYYYCCNRNYIKKIGNCIQNFSEYNSVLEDFVKSSLANPESRWICFIRSSKEIIENISDKDRKSLFRKALYNGKYLELYNELSDCIVRDSMKETLFLYEKGFLSFYVGNHKEATDIFLKLIDTLESTSKRNEMMLHIIQSSHGNPDSNNMNLIYSFINEMQSTNDFYSICATYWKKHIETEKGIFDTIQFEIIRKKIKDFTDFNKNPLFKSIIHRSFLDEIRCYHILGKQPPNEFLSEYIAFLKTCSLSRNEYYSNLYIEANTIHYVNIIDTILNDNYSSDDIYSLTKDAEYFYNRALNSSYSDEKSRRATRIKLLDLCMIFNNFEYENTINQINLFNIHSHINNVQVHVAFCETLSIKAKILNPNNFSDDLGFNINDNLFEEIHQHFEKGYKIYQEYANKYGMIRLYFLMDILAFLKSDFSHSNNINQLKEIKGRYNDYPKESHIIECLQNKCENGICSIMFMLSIIRVYPIILQ